MLTIKRTFTGAEVPQELRAQRAAVSVWELGNREDFWLFCGEYIVVMVQIYKKNHKQKSKKRNNPLDFFR